MKFATIIKEAGFHVKDFGKCADISVTLYDGKDRKVEREDIHYVEPLFAHNQTDFTRFRNFLTELEKNPVISMDVQITEGHVIVFPKTPNMRIFSRKKCIDPLDYAD